MSRPATAQFLLSPAVGVIAGGSMPGPVEAFEPVDLADYERLAPARMTPVAAEHLQRGFADERMRHKNQAAYQKLRLRPKVLVDVSQLDTRVKVFGKEMPFPIVLAPNGNHTLLRPEGEIATAKGAGMTGATWIVSASGAISLEEIARAANSSLWFQMPGDSDRGLTRELVQRAQGAGYQALITDLGRDGSTGWKDIGCVRGVTSMPVLVKGIANPSDAAEVIAQGAQGIIVSNYGVPNPDAAPATIDALPGIAAAVAGRIPVFVEGGVRRGTDVLKAVGLGATGVLIGRPCLQGLVVNGAAGVAHVIRILRRELEMAMASTGRPTIASIDDSVIWR